jgi:hypothetical protein
MFVIYDDNVTDYNRDYATFFYPTIDLSVTDFNFTKVLTGLKLKNKQAFKLIYEDDIFGTKDLDS